MSIDEIPIPKWKTTIMIDLEKMSANLAAIGEATPNKMNPSVANCMVSP